MDNPLVSIVLTNYNGEKYVMETIESVFRQTYENWELIIVDDCSTDQSYNTLNQLKDPRIKIVQTERNGQVSAAHNAGNRLAAGRYIACIDNDDSWFPDKLMKQVLFMEEHPEIGACFTLPIIIDDAGRVVEGTPFEQLFYVDNKSRHEWLHEMLISGSHLLNSSSLVRRDALEDIGDNNLCLIQLHDYEIWVRMALKYELYLIKEKLVLYRRFEGSNSLSQTNRINTIRAELEFSWIIGTTIRDMEPSEFKKVFYREMVNPEASSETEIACEKAILLTRDYLHGDCRFYAFEMFDSLLRKQEAADLLYKKYHLSQHDVYKMTGCPILYTHETKQEFQGMIDELAKVKEENQALMKMCMQKNEENLKLLKEKTEMENSTSWKVTKPLRKTGNLLKTIEQRARKQDG